ncbi:ferredoxin reductase domain-containing protein [Marivirga arenosa]|uniref:Ferredoxin-NADP reductase n=1 Tax=Marivirga arenosa TaxID=3059076 RepID=A0AA49GEL9_9BACT|nr:MULTISPECIES: ferredoxin-NADP reductase [unclassified Marivirga]WKK80655.2 ferredoxin-NADP reductase [Marivirga sp. BKB1-2]WMN06747.1 ferredoxin-NADP reductase [Marivirga sp. ABR2-2]
MAHLSDYDIRKQYYAKVLKTRRLSPPDAEEVRELTLEVQDPSFDCKIDQSFGVLVEKHDDFGNTLNHRLYSVADIPEKDIDKTIITLLVKRCNYIDAFSGELYNGIVSNYLCDRKAGDKIIITGPYELPFEIPEDKNANLILIGMGTGIAPFRAFIKHIYHNVKDWRGRILLFYGAKTGLELLYQNEEDDDLTNYYNEDTFKAIHAYSPRPLWHDPVVIDQSIEERSEEIIEMLSHLNTYIYIAGHKKVKEGLDKAFAKVVGSEEKWKARKAELKAGKKWIELIY